ncbi:MAG TPA: MATE family efflux transporter [Candidatus Eremiobacteraceae bacterium]|nr:MATE family efflux transporter [Candidatus Eremiobacteraceae bacterium]
MRPAGSTAPARGIFDETRPLWQVMALFLVPLVLSNILQSASGTVNAVFIGRLIGVDGLAAVSTLFPILFLLIGFLIGFSSGSTVLIGQAYGSKDDHKLKLVAGTSITATFLLGCISAAVGIIFAKEMLQLLGTPSNILADAIAYAHVIFAMLPLLFVYFAYISFMRGTGDSTTPFVALLLTTILSVLITPALILGWFGLPHLGVVSAAWAGLVANTLGLIGLLIYLRAIRHPLALDAETVHDLKINWPIFVQIVRIGVPTGIQVIMVSLAELAVISFVNRFGSHATAAYGAVNQIVSYVQFPAISIGITASIFGAQAIGANRDDLLAKVVRSGVGLNYIIGGTLITLCYIFKREIVGWFLTDQATLEVAVRLLAITLWSYLLFGNAAILSGIMRASGTVIVPTAISIAAIWGVEVPVAYFLSHRIGIDGIWIGYPAAFMTSLAGQTIYYFFVWKRSRHKRLI